MGFLLVPSSTKSSGLIVYVKGVLLLEMGVKCFLSKNTFKFFSVCVPVAK